MRQGNQSRPRRKGVLTGRALNISGRTPKALTNLLQERFVFFVGIVEIGAGRANLRNGRCPFIVRSARRRQNILRRFVLTGLRTGKTDALRNNRRKEPAIPWSARPTPARNLPLYAAAIFNSGRVLRPPGLFSKNIILILPDVQILGYRLVEIVQIAVRHYWFSRRSRTARIERDAVVGNGNLRLRRNASP